MDVIRTISPGQNGSIQAFKEWRNQLISVRCHKNSVTREVLSTTRTIVARCAIAASGRQIEGYLIQRDLQLVALKIGYHQEKLNRQVRDGANSWVYGLKER